jgi:selenocysteine lyase/cysteine desulfurase
VFEKGDPEYLGGGMARAVTPNRKIWSVLPDKEEAGSPNILGAVGLAAALKALEEVGMDNVAAHEEELTKYLHENLNNLPEIELFSPVDTSGSLNKVGVVTFNIKDVPYELASAILCYEGGFGVRAGCFCAQPYIRKAFKLTDEELDILLDKIANNQRVDLPGALRISFGIYNNKYEVDELIKWIKRIIAGDYIGEYELDLNSGHYIPKNFDFNPHDYFNYKTEYQLIEENL